MNRSPVRLSIFVSARGSNLRAIHESLASLRDASVQLALCLSNKSEPAAFEYCREHHIPTVTINPSAYGTEGEYNQAMIGTLAGYDIEMIALAGYLRRVPAPVVHAYRGRIINIHPALLPKFGGAGMYGRRIHEAVIAAGERESGATVHLVDEQYDTGLMLAQERVPILPDDTPETLSARVLKLEHQLYPDAVFKLAKRIREVR